MDTLPLQAIFTVAAIPSSITNYTITYFNSNSDGAVCNSRNVQSSCREDVCNYMFDIHTICPSTDISITVLATNRLGEGPLSDPITIGMPSQCTRSELALLAHSLNVCVNVLHTYRMHCTTYCMCTIMWHTCTSL